MLEEKQILFYPVYYFLSLIHPLCLGGFVTYFGQTDETVVTLSEACWYAAGVVLPSVFYLFVTNPFSLYEYNVCGKIRVGLSGLIYRKVLRMSKSSIDGGQIGKIINLLSNDLRTIDDLFRWIYSMWRGPFEVIFSLILLCIEIGDAAFIGMGFLLCFIPLQSKEFEIKIIYRCIIFLKLIDSFQ